MFEPDHEQVRAVGRPAVDAALVGHSYSAASIHLDSKSSAHAYERSCVAVLEEQADAAAQHPEDPSIDRKPHEEAGVAAEIRHPGKSSGLYRDDAVTTDGPESSERPTYGAVLTAVSIGMPGLDPESIRRRLRLLRGRKRWHGQQDNERH